MPRYLAITEDDVIPIDRRTQALFANPNPHVIDWRKEKFDLAHVEFKKSMAQAARAAKHGRHQRANDIREAALKWAEEYMKDLAKDAIDFERYSNEIDEEDRNKALKIKKAMKGMKASVTGKKATSTAMKAMQAARAMKATKTMKAMKSLKTIAGMKAKKA